MKGASWAGRPRIIITIAVCLVVLAFGVWAALTGIRQLTAIASVATALAQQSAAADEYAPAAAALDEQRTGAEGDLELADEVSALAPGLVTPEASDAFTAASEQLTSVVDEADAVSSSFDPVRIDDYSAGALESVAAAVRDQTAQYDAVVVDLGRLTISIADERDELAAAGDALFASTASVEPILEAASWVAPVDPKLAVRAALDAVADAQFDSDGLATLQEYSNSVAAMAQAHEAELTTFAGPYYDNKVAALAFANSISGGVLLEFNWVPELFGFGSGYGMGAQATLEGEDGLFYSRIDITENAAARWGDGGPEGIIAHEVGHAITKKCWDIFEASAGGDYEAFATAWAIGMGYTSSSNGTTAYGRPSDELIAATMACR
jgi:hypothetical protein